MYAFSSTRRADRVALNGVSESELNGLEYLIVDHRRTIPPAGAAENPVHNGTGSQLGKVAECELKRELDRELKRDTQLGEFAVVPVSTSGLKPT